MFATTDNRRGFALPLAILALALVTAAVAAAAAASRAEIVANQSARAQDKAYQMAEAGLQIFTARHGDPAWTCDHCQADPSSSAVDSEWTHVPLVGGYADVVSMRLRAYVNDANPGLFFIRSKGVDTTAKLSGNSLTVYAERTVGQYASFRTATIKPVAALVSLTGVSKNSNNSVIDGTDACGGAALTGVAVPTGEWTGTGIGSNVSSVNTSNTFAQLAGKLGIDWNAIINNNAIPADDTDVWPASTSWRVTRITSTPYTIPSDGKGILIASGDVTMSGNRDFDGIILVGGFIISTGNQPSSGLAITGLNYTLPGASAPAAGSGNNMTMTNNKQFNYNSCNVSQAIGLLNKYYVISNAWLDNVAVW